MFLRVRGGGASPENSQATLTYLRGFRLTNTRPPAGECKVGDIARPFLYPHFRVEIQTPIVNGDSEMKIYLHQTVWKELWNLYDIVYDELRLFPDLSVITALPSSSYNMEEVTVDTAEYTRLTALGGLQKAVVVTHHFSGNDLYSSIEDTCEFGAREAVTIVVLDVSNIPLDNAAMKIAVEVAWTSGYASLQGALHNVVYVVVRLPYLYNRMTLSGMCAPLVQEGLDFIAEHITLLVNSYGTSTCGETMSAVDIYFVGSEDLQLREMLMCLCSRRRNDQAPHDGKGKKEQEGVVIFTSDHYLQLLPKERKMQQEELLQSLASLLGMNMYLVPVPLKGFFDSGDEQWDVTTMQENKVLNFCPCCGHCGDH